MAYPKTQYVLATKRGNTTRYRYFGKRKEVEDWIVAKGPGNYSLAKLFTSKWYKLNLKH